MAKKIILLDRGTKGTFEEKKEKNIDNFEKRWAEAVNRIQSRTDGRVRLSLLPDDEDGMPVDVLDDVAIKGKIYFFQKYDPFWDDQGGGQDYTSPVVKNPTWLDIANLASEMIETTQDYSHLYLDGFEVISTNKGVKKAHFIMGS